MKIDNFFDKNSKSMFYIGKVSQVYRENAYVQIENLSLLDHRNIRLDVLIPNTINYFVIIDSVQGVFIGQIYQSKISSSFLTDKYSNSSNKDNQHPEMGMNILGFLEGKRFKLPGFKTVGLTDKVYIANKKLIQLYFESLETIEYKLYQDEKNQNSLQNIAQWEYFEGLNLTLHPNTLFDRHLMVIGTTNSGKSTSSLSILDKLVLSNKKTLIIDPTGEYNDSFKDCEVDKIILGSNSFISTDDVDDDFWIEFFNLNNSDSSYKAPLLIAAISSLRYQMSLGKNEALEKDGKLVHPLSEEIKAVKEKNFNLNLLVDQIKYEAVKDGNSKNGESQYRKDGNLYNSGIWLMKEVSYILCSELITNFFNMGRAENEGNLFKQLDKFLNNENNRSLYINASDITKNDSTGRTIIDLISNYIINHKVDKKPFVLFIDEVHRYTNKYDQTNGLTKIAREGRKNGIFLFLTTQNPNDVPEVLLGQVGSLIIHRLTQHGELKAIQNQVHPNTLSRIQTLNQGEAILTSINLLHDVNIRFTESKRPHDNKTPRL